MKSRRTSLDSLVSILHFKQEMKKW